MTLSSLFFYGFFTGGVSFFLFPNLEFGITRMVVTFAIFILVGGLDLLASYMMHNKRSSINF